MAGLIRIHAGWLIDGTGVPARRNVILCVRRGTIEAIEDAEKRHTGDGVVDLSWATVVPPFVDSHVHLAMSGSVDDALRLWQLKATCDELEPFITRHIRDLYSHGVLTVRDGGDRGGCVRRYLHGAGNVPIVIHTPGPAWHRQGRYGKLIGRGLAGEEKLSESFAGDGGGFDHVKLVNSGLNSLKQYGKSTRKQFSRSEIGQLAALACRQGKKIMVHANGIEGVRAAVEGGCHSVEHGFFMGRENLERMAEKGVIWVPTAVTMKKYAEVLADKGDREGADVARRNLEHQLDQIRQAREIGVIIALGSDSGSSGVLHGESLVEEMKLLLEGGFTLEEGIRCATSTGMRLLGREDRGTLEAGQPADFLVARGTPAQLPRKFSYLEGIFRGGRPDSDYRKNPIRHVA